MASEAEFWGRSLQGGTVCNTPSKAAIDAKMVSEAIGVLFDAAVDSENLDEAKAWDGVLRHASPEALAKLKRLLK